MAAVADVRAGAKAPVTRPAGRRRSFPVWRWAILLVAGAYFVIPLYAALRFAGLKAFPDVFRQSGFFSAIGLSLRLAVITTLLTLVLMVPRPRSTCTCGCREYGRSWRGSRSCPS